MVAASVNKAIFGCRQWRLDSKSQHANQDTPVERTQVKHT